MAVNIADFIRWTRAALTAHEIGGERCRLLALTEHPDRRLVSTVLLADMKEPVAEAIARELVADATSHATAVGGLRRYAVEAFFGDSREYGREYLLVFRSESPAEEPTLDSFFRTLIANEVARETGPLKRRIAELEARANGGEDEV